MRGVTGGEYIDIPEGWGETAFFGRLIEAGACRYESLVREPGDGGLTMRQVFDLHRMLDWRDYKSMTLAERRRPK